MGVATVVAAVGAAAAVYGSVTSANAANRAARAQQDAAGRWTDAVGQRNQEAEQAYDKYAPSQQAAIEKAMAGQERNIARSEALVNSIDPALLTAGAQMKQLLDGQSAPVLNQLKGQRDLQRNKMLDSLRQQMGPGAETSSMGQNMVMKFDAETANILSGAQQQYLNQVSNIAMSGRNFTDTMNEAQKTLASFGNSLGQIGLNKANLISGGTANLNAPMAAVTNAAGGQYKGDQIMGQMYGQLGAGAMQLGASMYSPSASGAPATPGAPDTAIADWMRDPNSGVQDYYGQGGGGTYPGAAASPSLGSSVSRKGGSVGTYSSNSGNMVGQPFLNPAHGVPLSGSVMQGTGIAMPNYLGTQGGWIPANTASGY